MKIKITNKNCDFNMKKVVLTQITLSVLGGAVAQWLTEGSGLGPDRGHWG